MQQDKIIFQMAAHFLPRVALRLESLYRTILEAYDDTHPIIHHYALNHVLEILKLIEKPELKSRFLKEMMRIEHILPKTNINVPNELYHQLSHQIHLVNQKAGSFGNILHQDHFLQTIRLTQQPQQADSELYSPQLLFWLETDAHSRRESLANWLKDLQILYDTVVIYLQLLREVIQFETVLAVNGFYQRYLSPKPMCHLIVLRIDKSSAIIPRVQIGHHGLNLRFCEAATLREVREVNAEFDLGICQI